jgi:hypothetical protein
MPKGPRAGLALTRTPIVLHPLSYARGEVVDDADEPGKGGLEEGLEDRLGREAGLGGTVDGA